MPDEKKPGKISAGALAEVEAALKIYTDEVLAAELSGWTKDTYVTPAANFVRWLNNEFTPGSRNQPYKRRLPYTPED